MCQRRRTKREAKPYRYVGVRMRRQQGELFGDGASVRYFAVVSNIWEMDGQALLDWHRGKAGTIEHVHHIIKSELGGGVYPSGKHGANAEPKRLIFAVFTGLGQIVHHARRVILKVLEELWATLIRASQERAMALSPPVC